MNYYITTFYNIRFLPPNNIPISTCLSDPKWFHDFKGKNYCFVDKRGIMNGIREPALCPELDIPPEDICCKDCSHKSEVPNCPFLVAHRKAIRAVDFDYIMSEFKRVAKDVRKITHFEGEPDIVLLVYEKEDNPCSERAGLIELFKAHNIELKEWKQEIIDFPLEDDELPF